MKTLPPEGPSFKTLYEMLIGTISSRLLMGGLNIGIFDVLENWRTAEEAASELDADSLNTGFFLDALTNIGLIEKSRRQYRNSPLAGRYLASDSRFYLGPLFHMTRTMSIDPLNDLETFVRSGPRPPATVDDTVCRCQAVESARASAPWALGEMGPRVVRIVSTLPGFSDFKKILDLGGGHGLFALYIVQASKILNAVVFDYAPVLELASELIASYGMGDRVTVMAGDYMTDDFGDGYDLVWASATLGGAKNNLEDLFSKVRNALGPNGYFISLHDGMTHEQTRPDMILEWLGGLLSTGQDLRFEQGELVEIMLDCGFRSVRSQTLQTPLGQMDLDIARK